MVLIVQLFRVSEMPQILTKPVLPKEKFSNFLNNRDNALAEAVQLSKTLQQELSSPAFDGIKQSLARSLNISVSQIHFFGSRVMGLASNDSDLDIFIDMEGSFYKGLEKEKQQLYLDTFKIKLLSSCDWKNVIEIREATVPILMLDYVGNTSNIKCKRLNIFKFYL